MPRRSNPTKMSLAVLWSFLLGLFFPCLASAQSAVQNVGVIQYNVKNSQGGWISYALPATLKLQVELIAARVKLGSTTDPSTKITDKNAPVDFISLVQSDLSGKNWDGEQEDDVIISDLLNKEGLKGWQTINSFCQYDGTELAYSPEWELVTDPNIVNPLVNAKDHSSPQHGWTWNGSQCDGRPYNIAYFKNKTTGFTLLFVIAHMPHCGSFDFKSCVNDMNGVPKIQNDIELVVGKNTDLTKLHFIMAGDMNEYGESNDPATTFHQIFPKFGTLRLSTALQTCCDDSNFNNRFDHILANSAASPEAYILDKTSSSSMIILYPLDPTFDDRTKGQCGTRKCHNEEHKAIFGLAQFP